MDEAGYGPNLGPLLIVATRWQTPALPEQCDFYQLLKQVVSSSGTEKWSKLHLADSKCVNVGKYGFRSLETSALALLHCLGYEARSFHNVLKTLCSTAPAPGDIHAPDSIAPWYRDDLSLPVEAQPEQVLSLGNQLQASMQNCGVSLQGMHADFVTEQRFNQLVETNGNKGLTLSRLAFRLLRQAWQPDEHAPVLMVGDKHGGRNRYDELLAEVLDGELIFRLEEGQQLSRYRIGQSELRFQVGGEAHLPVACASILAKYLRELAMMQLNAFWSKHCPGVKPTLGYPNDAKRFRIDVDAKRAELCLPDQLFWRMK